VKGLVFWYRLNTSLRLINNIKLPIIKKLKLTKGIHNARKTIGTTILFFFMILFSKIIFVKYKEEKKSVAEEKIKLKILIVSELSSNNFNNGSSK
jgi:hypothetical protein|tara:strand:- start:387 stop:671 length:285 start_codon:yes stop_codon:yes gene_type:complete